MSTLPPSSMDHHRVEVQSRLSDVDRAAVVTLATSASHADGVSALNEQTRLQMTTSSSLVHHLLVRAGSGTPVGYGQLDTDPSAANTSLELVVDPTARRRGIATSLVREAARLDPGRGLQAWAHGTLPAASGFAAREGFRAARQLLQLRRPLTGPGATDIVVPPTPDGIAVRTFVQGQDEIGWLAVNAAAFAHHREQGRWTMADLLAREREPWFDSGGFFLAVRTTDDTVVGFHWTKVDHRIGEVYVLGIDPSAQSGGLGKLLLTTGLRFLAERDCDTVELYVEADNVAARQLYERQGFVVAVTDTQYRRDREMS